MTRKVYLDRSEFLAQNAELKTNLPYSEDVSVLGKEFKIGSKTVPNRLVCQAMEGCDSTPDGRPGELSIRRYDRLARGGAGLIWYEASAVVQEGRANPRQLYINDDTVSDFARHLERIKETCLKENGYEPIVVMQITHSGRYSKPNGVPEPLIAYNNPIFEKDNPISKDRIVSDDYLDFVSEKLVHAAQLAEKAGFDGADIKCCHRYLNSELLSAYNRDGKYGGSLENRSRFLRESVSGAIEVCSKDFLVSTRMNVYDGFPYPNGFGAKTDGSLDVDLTEPEWVIKKLYESGVKLINISMGNPYFNPHVNRPFANGGYDAPEHPLIGVARVLEGIAELKSRIPEMAFISSAISYLGVAAPNVVAAYIKDGKFDFAGFGRTIFAYPDFAKDILQNGSFAREKCCICCSKCTEIMRAGGTPGCVIKDKEVYLPLYKKYCGGK